MDRKSNSFGSTQEKSIHEYQMMPVFHQMDDIQQVPDTQNMPDSE